MTEAADDKIADDGTQTGPSGIGGWLILPIIGFVGTIAATGYNLAQVVRTAGELMAVLEDPTIGLMAVKIPAVLSVVLGMLVVLSAAYCLYLIAARRRAIIAFATAHYLILAAASLVDNAWLGTTLAAPELNMEDLLRVIVVTMIWTAYFHKSKRVRNTFVKGAGANKVAAVFD